MCTRVDLCVRACVRACVHACVRNVKETQILFFKIFGLYLHIYVAFDFVNIPIYPSIHSSVYIHEYTYIYIYVYMCIDKYICMYE